jgi:hypothetical protein
MNSYAARRADDAYKVQAIALLRCNKRAGNVNTMVARQALSVETVERFARRKEARLGKPALRRLKSDTPVRGERIVLSIRSPQNHFPVRTKQ